MKARDILLGEGLTEKDIQELKNDLNDLMYQGYGGKEATDADALKEYFQRKTNRLQLTRERLPKKVEETKEYMERYRMGAEDVRSTAEELRQKAMKRKPRTPEPSPHNSDSEGEEVETLRLKAMKPRKIVEGGVQDKSDIYAEDKRKGDFKGEGMETTGAGLHTMYGEKHIKAKLTNAEVNELRATYWTKKETNIAKLAEKYKVAESNIRNILKRNTWSHLPQAEGEPDENYKAPNQNDLKVIKRAKELGVEPVANKIGRLRLPDEIIKKMRQEAATMKKKKEAKE